jgi:hypothetical protein
LLEWLYFTPDFFCIGRKSYGHGSLYLQGDQAQTGHADFFISVKLIGGVENPKMTTRNPTENIVNNNNYNTY